MKKLINYFLGRPHASLLPKVDFSVICPPDDYELKMLEPKVVDGNVSIYELFVINSLVRMTSPNRLFEFGTFNGRTALNRAANSPAQARIHTLDLSTTDLPDTKFKLDQIEKKFVEKPASGEKFVGRSESAKIIQILGDSARFDFAPYFGQIDFVFVDASHAYEYVLNDSQVALGLLRDARGVILWHDYGRPQWWPGVTRALDELQKNSPPFANLTHIEGTSLACLMKI